MIQGYSWTVAQTLLVLLPAMHVAPSIEIEADAIFRLTLLRP